MQPIRVYPNAKINLGLSITRKRADGFHDLETTFFPVRGLHDTLEISGVTQAGSFLLEIAGNQELASETNNILERAYELLSPFSPPKLRVHLTKRIPIGGGLGGGSADAAFFLHAVAPLCKETITPEQLKTIALELGSDCPFFLLNTPAVGRGRGELLTPIALQLQGYILVVVVPAIQISTKEAFAAIKPQSANFIPEEVLRTPVELWAQTLTNDFQAYVTAQYPAIRNLLISLKESGAVYTSLSGSGSAVFGLYRHLVALPALPNCLVHIEQL